jgi:hypothetical protein
LRCFGTLWIVHHIINVDPIISQPRQRIKVVLTAWIENYSVSSKYIPTLSNPTKKELAESIVKVKADTQFIAQIIANKYEHKLMFTPPYHLEFQPIEKVWAIVKQPVAHDPDLDET